jgi:hypothetical protein
MVRSTKMCRTGTRGAGDTTSAATTGATKAASSGTVTRSVPTGFRSHEERAGIRLQPPLLQHSCGVLHAKTPEQKTMPKKTAIKAQQAIFDSFRM